MLQGNYYCNSFCKVIIREKILYSDWLSTLSFWFSFWWKL